MMKRTDPDHWTVYALVSKPIWKKFIGLRLESRIDEIVENAIIEEIAKEIGEHKDDGSRKQY